MSGHRPDRVASQLHREVSRLLLREVKDPRVSSLRVTRVEVTPDLSLARIMYLSPDEDAEDINPRVLKRVASFMRGRLGRLLRMRSVPELRFTQDKGLEGALQMSALWQEVRDRRDALPEGALPETGSTSEEVGCAA